MVLFVDDNRDLCAVLQRLWQETGTTEPLVCLHDGVHARAYLQQQCPFRHAERPRLVVLDLNMPGLTGLQVLQWIRHQPDMHDLPVVMLTGSSEPLDETWARYLKVHAFVEKGNPDALDTAIHLMTSQPVM